MHLQHELSIPPSTKRGLSLAFVVEPLFRECLSFQAKAAFDMDTYFFNTEGHPLKRHEL